MNDFIISIYYNGQRFNYLSICNCKYTLIPVLLSYFEYARTYICSAKRNLKSTIKMFSLGGEIVQGIFFFLVTS